MKKRKGLSSLLAFIMVFAMLFGITAQAAYVETENGFLYNETSARSVTVTVTLSSDGYPILANNAKETPMEVLEVTVPYFDLGVYGLEQYYRYKAGDSGFYSVNDKEVIRRPTVLHLYIYLLERYYLGLNESQCGIGYDKEGLFDSIQGGTVNNIWGEAAFTKSRAAFVPSGGACSIYMTSFWGHDENLLYYVNGEYPLWRRGRAGTMEDSLQGATSDYILLENGDRIDVGMFSNSSFCWNMKGGFLYFPEDSYVIREDESITVDKITRKYGFMGTGFETRTYYDDLDTYNYLVKCPDGTAVPVTDEDYSDGITFDGFEEAGTYYIYAVDKAAGDNSEESEAICTPGIAKVTVKEAPSEKVKQVLDLVNGIGEVSYSKESEDLIVAARNAYDALSEEEKNSIFADELVLLTNAEKAYEELEKEAVKKAEEAKKKAEEEAKKKAEEEALKKAEQEAKKKAEEEALKKAEQEEAKKKAEEEAKVKAEKEAAEKAAEIKTVNDTNIQSLKAKKNKTSGIKLTWKNDSNLEGYEVYRSAKKDSGYKLVATVTAPNYTLKKGLNKNKTYYYKVRGYKTIDGEKAYTGDTRICVNLNQSKAIKAISITGLKATVTKGKVTLTWDKHESMYNLKGYKIYKSTKRNSGYKVVKSVKKETVVIKSGLKKGKTYYFKIQGYAKVGKKTVMTKKKVIKVKAK